MSSELVLATIKKVMAPLEVGPEIALGPFCNTKNWYDLRYDLRYDLLYIKPYLKLCKNLLGKPNFPRIFLHNLRYDFEV